MVAFNLWIWGTDRWVLILRKEGWQQSWCIVAILMRNNFKWNEWFEVIHINTQEVNSFSYFLYIFWSLADAFSTIQISVYFTLFKNKYLKKSRLLQSLCVSCIFSWLQPHPAKSRVRSEDSHCYRGHQQEEKISMFTQTTGSSASTTPPFPLPAA